MGNAEFNTPWLLWTISGLFAIFSAIALKKSVRMFILNMLLFTIAFLVIGVMGYGWYLPEICALFLALAVASGISASYSADKIAAEFVAGAKDIFSAALIIGFAYFYTQISFNPLEVANNMKKAGGFIPGMRPGKTTSDYLSQVLNYIVFIGAIFLAFIAVVPIFFNGVFGASVSFAGTSIIIVVGVIIETLKQIESQMRVRNYKGFLND